jgi:tetratricopeptide (TPR) repeat protein
MMSEGRSFSGNERHCIYLNTLADPAAAGRFANVSAVSGLDFPDDGRAVAVVDWDQDGKQDLWISNRNAPRLRFMRNNAPSHHHFVALRLQGNGKSTSRDAIGARVEVILAPLASIPATSSKPLVRTLRAGEGFLAQSSKWLHFGLGDAEAIEKVRVRWPGGAIEEFAGMEVDRRYRLVQGSGSAVEVKRASPATKLEPAAQKVLPSTEVARIPMVEMLTMPLWIYQDADGIQQPLRANTDRLLLVNLWSKTCAPCLRELKEFAQRSDELKASGIDVVALSIDALGKNPVKARELKSALHKYAKKYPFRFGTAPAELVVDAQFIHDIQFALNKPLPLPCSFLLDSRNRLAAIYKGPVPVDALLEDAAHPKRDRTERAVKSALVAGRTIDHPRVRQTATNLGVNLRFQLADYFIRNDRRELIAAQYADILEIRPETPEAHYTLGTALVDAGRPAEALAHFEAAIQIDPDQAESHYNLGRALQVLDRSSEALGHYQEAVRIQPDYPSAHYNWGIALYALRRPQEAISHFLATIQLKPDHADAHYNLGAVYAALGRINDALISIRKSIELDPQNEQYRRSLAKLEQAIGNRP